MEAIHLTLLPLILSNWQVMSVPAYTDTTLRCCLDQKAKFTDVHAADVSHPLDLDYAFARKFWRYMQWSLVAPMS